MKNLSLAMIVVVFSVAFFGVNAFAEDFYVISSANKSSLIHKKSFVDVTEYTHTGNTDLELKKVLSLVAPANSLVLGVRVRAELKSSGSNSSRLYLELQGTTLGSHFLGPRRPLDTGPELFPGFPYWSSFANTALSQSGDYYEMAAYYSAPIELLDNTTNVNIYLKTSQSGETAYFKELELDFYYVTEFVKD